MNKWIVMVDYNLSRYDDVRMMFSYAKEKYNLGTILIRKTISEIDARLADISIELDPRGENFVELVIRELTRIKGPIVAVLPFSDDGVWNGAKLADVLGLIGDDPNLAKGAFSKIEYRRVEQDLKHYLSAQGVFVPHHEVVTNFEDLRRLAAKFNSSFVIKPSTEGNNRGVVLVNPEECLVQAFREVESYIKNGVIVEELIPFKNEYSFDGIGNLNFVTKKMSHHGRYPVEEGQIVGLNLEETEYIKSAGRLANFIVGQSVGPFHNEVRFDPTTKQTAIIEPNRRPAGMKIWHLAEKVYGVNFFKLWIDQLLGVKLPNELPQPKGVAAIKQLRAPMNGVLNIDITPELENSVFRRMTSRVSRNDVQWYGFKINKTRGQFLDVEPKDNSGFMAEVSMFTSDPTNDVQSLLSEFENVWKMEIMNAMEGKYEAAHTA